jgi:CRISPR type I-A-associated protein Csa5
MSIKLNTPATGFPDLKIKIAYGLARVGIETFGMEQIAIQDGGGFYTVTVDIAEDEFYKLDRTFNLLCNRLLSSLYIPFSTPGIAGRSAESISVDENESFSLDIYKSMEFVSENRARENICRHRHDAVSNIIGLTVSTSFHNKRDGLDIQLQYKNPKDKTSPKLPRRPTNPKNICKTCALLSLLGTWYATFIFNVADREIIAIPIPKEKIAGSKLQEIFALQHQIRKSWINQEIPQVIIPLIFLSKIPSSADILDGFDLFIAVLSRQQGYHVDGLFLIPIEDYLDFIRQTPFNIATIDAMIRREAYGSLQELNNAIYNREKVALPKFARLYVQETSTKDWINLLYPETTKYLLKEVAMINEEIINNKAVRSVAKTLGYFVWNKDYQNYSFADGLRNAKTHKEVRQIFEKLEREAKLRYDQEKNKQNGNPPHLPHPDDIVEINRLMQKDDESFTQVKTTLYLFAFTWESYKTIRLEEEVQNA